jgi:class 3 adenylate cyclase
MVKTAFKVEISFFGIATKIPLSPGQSNVCGMRAIVDASARLRHSNVFTNSPLRDTLLIMNIAGEEFPETATSSIEFEASALSALKKMPVDIFDNVYVGETRDNALILCIDIRNFSSFLRDNDENTVFSLIKDFTSNFLSCVNQFGCNCSYYKLIGDGAIVIWDEAGETSLKEALEVFTVFVDFLNEELFAGSPILSLAGALVLGKIFKYEISAEVSGLKYRDYVGYGINLACRLQTLAEKDELIVNLKLVKDKRLPFVQKEELKEPHALQLLKGMKEEDRAAVYLYKRPDAR